MDDIRFCAIIGVDCMDNDPEEIAKGKNKKKGFTFVVKREDADDTIMFIKEKLEEYNVPYEDIYVYKSMDMLVTSIWDREKIEETIKNGSEIIRKEQEERSKKK